MIRCYHCGTDNLDGSEYCDECGTKLNAASSARSAYAPPQSFPSPISSEVTSQNVTPPAHAPMPPPPPAFTRDTITPKPATPYTPPPPPVFQAAPRIPPSALPPPASSAGSQAPPIVTTVEPVNQTASFNGQTGSLRSNPFNAESGQQSSMSTPSPSPIEVPTVRAKLIIQRGGKIGKEFSIVSVEAMIGRWDADGGIFPDVDLDQDDPEAKVSRRHARIQFLNNQYLIEDLGSTNGTFVNRGPRLLPGIKQPLNNGDEIIVGKTFLKFILS
jgi:hypothetical protein